MTIHYQNYKRFSVGQGFAGVLCRGLGAQVSSGRWPAVDCQACRDKIIDVEVISREGERGIVQSVEYRGAYVLIFGAAAMIERRIPWAELDKDWVPLRVALRAVFGNE